jgi:hypothetical protein
LTKRIEFDRSAAKTYSRLDPMLLRRLDRGLNRLSETPRHPGLNRLQSDDELYRMQIGDLRLGKQHGLLGLVFRKVQNTIQDFAKLKRQISDLPANRSPPGPGTTKSSNASHLSREDALHVDDDEPEV